MNRQNQSNKILNLVGQHGENLKGATAKSDQLGGTELEATKTVNLKLSITPPKPSTNGNYSWNHPVPSAYLLQFLNFMNDYYNGMKTQIADPNQMNWDSYVAKQNARGWYMYGKVNYYTNPQEDPDVYHARSDTAQAWVFLNGLEQDYDSEFSGDGKPSSDSINEQQFHQFYTQALKEARNIQ